jgi:hypothetical protein
MPISLTLRHRFHSLEHIRTVDAPVLVLRAEVDTVIPHARTDALIPRISNLAADETIPGSDHCNIPYLAPTQERIATFLTQELGVSWPNGETGS